jgi:hypothetical protein
LFTELRRLRTCHPEISKISANLTYLQKCEPQLQYPHFQAEGWPIGDGIVESGNKLVVEVRLKGSGMHWDEHNVNPMLALRNIICSRRWKEEWPRIESRRQPALIVAAETPIVASPAHLEIPLPTPKKLKDPKDNPWRKFKYGRTLYQRDYSPKK